MSDSPRKRSHAAWPVRIYRLGEEPRADLSAVTTAEERLAIASSITCAAADLEELGE